jgi:hypothetical protein
VELGSLVFFFFPSLPDDPTNRHQRLNQTTAG